MKIGTVCEISNTSGRTGVICGQYILDDRIFHCVYPTSLAVYLASDLDFICQTQNQINTALMVETWNPLLLDPAELTITDKISKDFIEAFSKFVYFKLLNQKLPEYKFFTGPPISSKDDIRLLFKEQEMKVFHNIRSKITDTLLIQNLIIK